MKTINRFFLLAVSTATLPFLVGCRTDPEGATGPPSISAPNGQVIAPTTDESPPGTSGANGTSDSKMAGPPAPPPGPKNPADFDKAPFKGNGKVITLPGGLKYEDMTIGTGATAETGKIAVMHYTGTLTNGTKFDSSRDRNETFPVPLGAGRVIKGWDQGIPGMKVGGRRKLTIPGALAYPGGTPDGAIPPGATIVFDVELMDVQEAGANPAPF